MIKFNEKEHIYELDGKQLISVTQLLRKHGLAPDFSNVDEETLRRKAERGTMIHKEIENYVTTGDLGFTQEFYDFRNFAKDLNLVNMKAEQVVYNDLVAGTLDLTAERTAEDCGYMRVIIDHKTSSHLDKNYLRWQLSVYEYLSGQEYDKFYCFHLADKSKIIEIERIPRAEIERLMECERKGDIYKPSLAIDNNLLLELRTMEETIKKTEEQVKLAKEQQDIIKKKLITAMADSGVKSFENDIIKITYIAPSVKKMIDTKALWLNYPEVATAVTKASPTSASVRITLRG